MRTRPLLRCLLVCFFLCNAAALEEECTSLMQLDAKHTKRAEQQQARWVGPQQGPQQAPKKFVGPQQAPKKFVGPAPPKKFVGPAPSLVSTLDSAKKTKDGTKAEGKEDAKTGIVKTVESFSEKVQRHLDEWQRDMDEVFDCYGSGELGNTTVGWPSARGAIGRYSWSPSIAPLEIDLPDWDWHDPAGLWGTICLGTSIDDHKHIYVTAANGIRKFNEDGDLLWMYNTSRVAESIPYEDPSGFETLYKVAAVMGEGVYGISSAGRAFALDRMTGKELWSTMVTNNGSDHTAGHVMAHDGVVITAVDVSSFINRPTPSCCGPMNHKVVGLDSTSGKKIWEFEPDRPVQNFGVAFAGDDTFVYQDLEGYVYRNWVKNGSLVWKADTGVKESWTDGQANLGANGIVYSVANYGMDLPRTSGYVAATRLSDGKMLWKHDFHGHSPNSIPAVGYLSIGEEPGFKTKTTGKHNFSVVVPVGLNDMIGATVSVYALDAETGEKQWKFNGPRQKHSFGEGDQPEHQEDRRKNHVPTVTLPNAWGVPIIDGRGTVYVGGTTGQLFALRDLDGDGNVDGHHEVTTFSTDAAFVGSSAPAIAEGLMAIGNANSLYVWKCPGGRCNEMVVRNELNGHVADEPEVLPYLSYDTFTPYWLNKTGVY